MFYYLAVLSTDCGLEMESTIGSEAMSMRVYWKKTF